MSQLVQLGAELGSDVPFFLTGGCALGLGRGTDLYVMPDPPQVHGLLIAPSVHVSTAEAYGSLNRPTGLPDSVNIPRLTDPNDWRESCVNNFEASVFRAHPELAAIKKKLQKLGARPALMTGSGAAIFGIFDQKETLDRARLAFPDSKAHPFTFVSRSRYRAIWRKQLL
jgi:4-diphosphocytidyl-2-C-methyl-D-erythritol kinase